MIKCLGDTVIEPIELRLRAHLVFADESGFLLMLNVEWFPGYAPEFNPDELAWAHFKASSPMAIPRSP